MTITNMHQRKVTAARLAEFERKLCDLRAQEPSSDDDAIARRLAIAQTTSYIAGFRSDLAEFDELVGATKIAVGDVEGLGDALVRARVASGLTQAQLAERVGLATSAINRYEANSYRSAGLARLAEIASGLDFQLEASFVRSSTGA